MQLVEEVSEARNEKQQGEAAPGQRSTLLTSTIALLFLCVNLPIPTISCPHVFHSNCHAIIKNVDEPSAQCLFLLLTLCYNFSPFK